MLFLHLLKATVVEAMAAAVTVEVAMEAAVTVEVAMEAAVTVAVEQEEQSHPVVVELFRQLSVALTQMRPTIIRTQLLMTVPAPTRQFVLLQDLPTGE
jgi:hypothetical protein